MKKDRPNKPTRTPEMFWLSDDSRISETELKNADRHVQIEAMRNWFYGNFEDPVHETPFDSGEGGYQYIHGGPYDAGEELSSRFEGLVPQDAIDELAAKLWDESSEWAPHSEGAYDLTDYDVLDDYLLEGIGPLSGHAATFNANIDNILKLTGAPVDDAERQFFRRLLFAAVITTLETYLSDVFVSSIRDNPAALRKFVESFPDFATEKLARRDVFKEFEQIEHRVTSMLVKKMIWHRLERVAKLFKDTFDIDFTHAAVVEELLGDIEIRHDIVHRNGKRKDGGEHSLSDDDIRRVIANCVGLVQTIERDRGTFTPMV